MSLLENAVRSIRLGVEDYQTDDDDRLIAAARNLHAGILLLFKEKLRRLSPPDSDEVLIKEKIRPILSSDGHLRFTGSGKKTVDVQSIRERFDSLQIKTDWARVDRITSERNNLEHYYPRATREVIRGLLADACLVVRNFITDELDAEPVVLLGENCWEALLEVAEVFDEERKACRAAMAEVEWTHETLKAIAADMSCDQCGSELVRPQDPSSSREDLVLICRSCGAEESFSNRVEGLVAEHFRAEAHAAARDGDDDGIYGTCPSCFLATYVASESCCVACDFEPSSQRCGRCDASLEIDELGEGYCSWCSHMMNKDD